MKPYSYISHLLRYAFGTNPLLYLAVLLALVSSGIELLAMASLLPLSALALGQPLGHSRMLGALQQVGLAPTMTTLLKVFLVLLGLRVLFTLTSQGLTIYLSKRVQNQLSSSGFRHFIKFVQLRELESKSIGTYISLAGDEAARAGLLVVAIVQLAGTLALSLLYFCGVAHLSWKIALGVSAFLAFAFLCLGGVFLRSQRLGKQQVDLQREANSVFLDSFNSVRSVRAFLAEDHVSDRYQETHRRYTLAWFWIEYLQVVSRNVPVLLLVAVCFAWATLAGSGSGGESNLAVFVTLTAFLLRFFPAVGQCLNTFLRIMAESKAGQDIVSVITATERPADHEALLQVPLDETVERISVDRIGFAYDPARPVLTDLSLELLKGRSYALIGPSGIGKSSLLDLLLKYYSFGSGAIRINGRDIKELSTAALRSRVLLLGQQVTLFNDTVRANLAFGRDLPLENIRKACQLACIEDVILAMPKGFDTVLTYQATNLSGGQRQRLALARALVREPDVLILDESTSALDQDTRSAVVKNLLEAYRDRILLFVTHDPSVADRVDEVIDMRQVNRTALPPDLVVSKAGGQLAS